MTWKGNPEDPNEARSSQPEARPDSRLLSCPRWHWASWVLTLGRLRLGSALGATRMKYAAVILMLTLVGCGRRPAVLAEPVRVMNQVHQWVPSGTPTAEAEQILAAHQFSWSLVTNSSFAESTDAALLVCHPPAVSTQATHGPQKWSIVLVLTNGSVSSVHLTKPIKDS